MDEQPMEMIFVDNSPKPLTVGGLMFILKVMKKEGDVTDNTPVILPGYRDIGYEQLTSISRQKVIVNKPLEEDSYNFSRYRSLQTETDPKDTIVEAVVLRSDKYLMRNPDAPE